MARPTSTADLASSVLGVPEELARAVIAVLHSARILSPIGVANLPDEDDDASLGLWEFHDLLFHVRSREGRNRGPIGTTYRHAAVVPPPPAVAPLTYTRTIDLERPDIAGIVQRDPSFTTVLEQRRSILCYAQEPITLSRLSEFLYRSARITERRSSDVDTPVGPITMDFARRPYPAAGALYGLEIYLAVNSCGGLDSGLYHYNALVS